MSNINITSTAAYMALDSWILANVVQLATFDFCRKFLNRTNDPCGRMFDQMTQAARSIQANIAEGTSRGQTSTETEMKLLDVARASASELASDYMFVLMLRGETSWENGHAEAMAVRTMALDRPWYGKNFVHDAMAHIIAQRKKFDRWTTAGDVSVAANALLILCSREISMLTHQIQSRLEKFKKEGGFAENLTKARYETLATQNADTPKCPKCGATMVQRVIKRGYKQGERFWGCTRYPACDGTANIKNNAERNKLSKPDYPDNPDNPNHPNNSNDPSNPSKTQTQTP